MKTESNYKVILPVDARPGLLRCGDMVPGTEYEVPATEAVRLVDHKGFAFVVKAHEKPAREEATATAAAAERARQREEKATQGDAAAADVAPKPRARGGRRGQPRRAKPADNAAPAAADPATQDSTGAAAAATTQSSEG